MPDTSESMGLAHQALKVAADAMAHGGPSRRAEMSSGEFQTLVLGLVNRQREELPGAEFQGILLGMVNELRTDSREHRNRLEDMRVRLVEGDGRMGRIESQGQENTMRLNSLHERLVAIERGSSSGMQRAIKSAVAEAAARDGARQQRPAAVLHRLRASILLRLIGAIATVATVGVGGYFTLRQAQTTAPPPDPQSKSAQTPAAAP